MSAAKPTPTRLGRPAEGLARYYLDCGWWRHPSFDDLSAEALMVWQAAVSYSNEHTTDGRLPANVESLSLKLGLRLTWVRRALRELIDAGRWNRDGKGLVIVGFLDHNPSKAEVKAWTEERSQRGTLGNHKRWHEARGLFDPECVHCTSDHNGTSRRDRSSDRKGDRNSDSVSDRKGDRMGWDGMGSIPPNPPYRPATEPLDTTGASPAPGEETDQPITDPVTGEYRGPTLPAVGDGLRPEHLWPEMARRTWYVRHQQGDPPPNPHTTRGKRWLSTTAASHATEHSQRAPDVIAATIPGTPADYVIWELDPDLALRNWAIPNEPPPPLPDDRATPEETRAAVAGIRQLLHQRTQTADPGDPAA